MPPITRIGVLTGGGDAPGLNAVIRAVVKSAYNAGIECIGLEDSFDGLLEPGRSRTLTPRDVRGIMPWISETSLAICVATAGSMP